MAKTVKTMRKDPDATLDYWVDWSEWLEVGETIAQSTWSVPEGLTAGELDEMTDDHTVVWISGGTDGQSYVLTNRIVTSKGRIDDRSIQIVVEDR